MFSDSGIIKQAEKAREETKITNYKEAINLHLLEARMGLTNGNEEEVLSKAKELVKGDSKFSKATVSEIVDSSFTVTTEEGYKFVTTPNGVEYTGKDTSQSGNTENTESNETVNLTVKYVDQNGNQLQEGYVETYKKNEIIQISASPIVKDDIVYTADYLQTKTENGVSEWKSDGKLSIVSFQLEQDVEADIVYIINSEENLEAETTKTTIPPASTNGPVNQSPINPENYTTLPPDDGADDKIDTDVKPMGPTAGTMEITFDMKGRAQPGDAVSIYHYDKTRDEWETLTKDEIMGDNLLITVEVTSFSPFRITIQYNTQTEPVSVKNPYGKNNYELAWVYDEENGWDENVYTPETISQAGNYKAIVKLYPTGNTITPPSLDFNGATIPFNPDKEYDMVIEKNENILGNVDINGALAEFDESGNPTAGYAWLNGSFSYVMGYINSGGSTEGLPTPYSMYVKKAYVCDGISKLSNVFFGCTLSLENAYISDTVIQMGDSCFVMSNIKNISLPGIKTINDYTFECCYSLESVSMHRVEVIKQGAFRYCTNLKSIYMPNVRKIGRLAFYFCKNLDNIIIPNATEIGEDAFRYCENLKSVSMDSIVEIGDYAFTNTVLEELVLPETLSSIGDYAFAATNLKTVKIRATLANGCIGRGAFGEEGVVGHHHETEEVFLYNLGPDAKIYIKASAYRWFTDGIMRIGYNNNQKYKICDLRWTSINTWDGE